jgi:amino acid transporter
MAKVFTFLVNLVAAANLPLYLACSLAVLTLWRRGEITRVGPRHLIWFGAALFAAIYCIWSFIGAGREPLLWANTEGRSGATMARLNQSLSVLSFASLIRACSDGGSVRNLATRSETSESAQLFSSALENPSAQPFA